MIVVGLFFAEIGVKFWFRSIDHRLSRNQSTSVFALVFSSLCTFYSLLRRYASYCWTLIEMSTMATFSQYLSPVIVTNNLGLMIA